MNTNSKWLRLRQLDELLHQFRPLKSVPIPRQGWIKTIREALGMTAQQLAQRLGVVQSAVVRLEHREVEGTVTLALLQRAADALHCDLVYAFVPRATLEETVTARVQTVAADRAARVTQTMALEQQRPSEAAITPQVRDLTLRLMHDWPRDLWS
jgi:predicted DNA-binding mobile mystery protein A